MLVITGCAAPDWSKEPLPVSISAANYSQVSGEELYMRVNGAVNTHPVSPAVPEPTRPFFYAFVPGEVYASHVPLETVYRELSVPLAHRGYFNVVYQAKAGLFAPRIDYLLRVHFGERYWRKPTVRTDKVTWGDDGLVSKWNGTHGGQKSVVLFGPESRWDSREGLSPDEVANVAMFFQGGGWQAYQVAELTDNNAASDYGLVMVEAFRFDDVRFKKSSAPCIWATFIAVPLHQNQEFSSVLRTMAQTATPYFGATTDGLQLCKVAPGKVLIGEPVEVYDPSKSSQPSEQASPRTP